MKYKFFISDNLEAIIDTASPEKEKEFYGYDSYEEYVLTDDEQDAISMADIRKQRDILLNKCDHTQIADSPLTAEEVTDWATYRQELRDFPSVVDLTDIVWPTLPE